MKTFRTILVLSMFFLTHWSNAQIINNKGNRSQSYPKVDKINEQVKDRMDEISISDLENSIRWMQDLGCRDAQSQEAVQTQNWLMDQYESYGLYTYIHSFPCEDAVYLIGSCTTEPCDGDILGAGNIVAIQYGTEYPDEYIVVSCHYDHPDGPGADDNASGTAGVLEIARILSKYEFKRSIMYVSFNAEEYWMIGSYPFVEKCAKEDLNILGCFNLDMLGFFPEDIGSLEMFAGHAFNYSNLFNFYSEVANLYVPEIPTKKFSINYINGDAQPFNEYDYPSLYIGDIEYLNDHPCYHKDCDTLGKGVNNMDLVKAYTQSTLAAVAELANGWLPPQNLSAIQNEEEIILSWNKSDNTSKYQIYKNETLLTETFDTCYKDTELALNNYYTYYVKSVKNGTSEISNKSNLHPIWISSPLDLPHFNDFEDYLKGWRGYDCTINSMESHSGSSSFSNSDRINQSGNLYSLCELKWFSIPDTVKDISVSFYLKGIIQHITWNDKAYENCHMYMEITKDNKNWEKLLKINGEVKDWSYYGFSLNKYIGEPFVQLRIRIESLAHPQTLISAQIFMDDFKIDFSNGLNNDLEPIEISSINIKISPNPSTGLIKIETGAKQPYEVDIFDISGIRIIRKENCTDGMFDLSHLSKGIYYIRISLDQQAITKKITIL